MVTSGAHLGRRFDSRLAVLWNRLPNVGAKGGANPVVRRRVGA